MNLPELSFLYFLTTIMLLLILHLRSNRRIERLEKDNARYMGIVLNNPHLFHTADLEQSGGDKKK